MGGYRHSCKKCVLAKNLEYRVQHREEIRAQKRDKWAKHKEEIRPRKNELQRQYYQRHREDLLAKQKIYRIEHKDRIRTYQQKHKSQRRIYLRKYYAGRRSNDELYRFAERIRARIGGFLRKRGFEKPTRTEEIIGKDFNSLWEYLCSTWEKNYGKPWAGEPYHIDHIVPLATAKTKEDILRLCHYSNLQMLTPEDNLKKGDK